MINNSLKGICIPLAAISIACSAETANADDSFFRSECGFDRTLDVIASLKKFLNKDSSLTIEECNKIKHAERSQLFDVEYFSKSETDLFFREFWINPNQSAGNAFVGDVSKLSLETEIKSKALEGQRIPIQTLNRYSSVSGSSK